MRRHIVRIGPTLTRLRHKEVARWRPDIAKPINLFALTSALDFFLTLLPGGKCLLDRCPDLRAIAVDNRRPADRIDQNEIVSVVDPHGKGRPIVDDAVSRIPVDCAIFDRTECGQIFRAQPIREAFADYSQTHRQLISIDTSRHHDSRQIILDNGLHATEHMLVGQLGCARSIPA